VNISRYGMGSASSMGRWEGTGLAGCFDRGRGTERAENGRKEHSRLDIGAGSSFSASEPVISEMNLLENSQLLCSLETVNILTSDRHAL
jgi:hypothetical protein